MESSVLERVNGIKDLKTLTLGELNKLSDEIREVLIKKVSTTGGHFGPNLGMVEATIALHYVFNSPKDKIVYDVSHQSYTHKFNNVKDTDNPTVIHMHTIKGKGYEDVEENKEAFHWVMPFDLETKESKFGDLPESYTDIAGKFLVEKAKEGKRIVAITSATPAPAG